MHQKSKFNHTYSWHHNNESKVRTVLSLVVLQIRIVMDLNCARRYRPLELRQPVTQGKHSVKRSLYKALHKRLSLVLRRWRPAGTISYRPFLKHQQFAVWSLYRRVKSAAIFKSSRFFGSVKSFLYFLSSSLSSVHGSPICFSCTIKKRKGKL